CSSLVLDNRIKNLRRLDTSALCGDQAPSTPIKRSWAIASIIAALIVGASVYIYTSSRPIDNGQPVANASCRRGKSNGLYLRALQDGSGVPLNGVGVKASPATLCNGVETVTAILLE